MSHWQHWHGWGHIGGSGSRLRGRVWQSDYSSVGTVNTQCEWHTTGSSWQLVTIIHSALVSQLYTVSILTPVTHVTNKHEIKMSSYWLESDCAYQQIMQTKWCSDGVKVKMIRCGCCLYFTPATSDPPVSTTARPMWDTLPLHTNTTTYLPTLKNI